MQAVPAAGRPPGHDADHDLRHEADQPLHLEDVQPPGPARLDRLGRSSPLGVLVAVVPTDALVAAGAERPAAVPRRRPVAREQHAADVGRHPGVVEGACTARRPCAAGTRCAPPGRSNAMRTVPWSTARWYVMSVKSNPSTDPPRGRVEQLADGGRGSRARSCWPTRSTVAPHAVRRGQRAAHLLPGHRRRRPAGDPGPRVPDGPHDVRPAGRGARPPTTA